MRNDGHVIIYVIKHVHPHTLTSGFFGWDGTTWAGSGDCSQFPASKRDLSLFSVLGPGGEVWQKHGIYGTFNRNDARHAAREMCKSFPDYHWSVHEVEIMQKTSIVSVFKTKTT